MDIPIKKRGGFIALLAGSGTPVESVVGFDHVTIPSGVTTEFHLHRNSDSVILILSGTGRIRIGRSYMHVRPMQRFVVGRGVVHGFVVDPASDLVFVAASCPPIVDAAGVVDVEVVEPFQSDHVGRSDLHADG
jgi:mannose-6-phosphate isomerase-like protein (cupin superfamily)